MEPGIDFKSLQQEAYQRMDVLWATMIGNSVFAAMDIFLVLSGLFAGLELIPSLKRTSNSLTYILRYLLT